MKDSTRNRVFSKQDERHNKRAEWEGERMWKRLLASREGIFLDKKWVENETG